MTSGLIRVRTALALTRRQAIGGLAAAAGAAAFGLPAGRVRAASTVTFLGWQDYDKGLSAGDFLAQNDITMNTTYIGNNDDIVTRLSAGGVGQIDLVTPYMGYIPLLAAAGLIQPIDEAKVPNLRHVLEPFKSDPNIIIDGVRYGVPFTWGSGPMLYNPEEMEAPKRWADLLDPKFAGKIGMMNDPLGNVMLAARIATDAESATSLTRDQLKAAIDWLVRLKPSVRVVAVSWGDLADALARRDVTVTFNGWETISKFTADKGLTTKYVYPEEGTYAWLDNYCIATDAPNLDVDLRLCDQIISAASQRMIGDDLLQGIVSGEAVPQLTKSGTIYPYDDLASFSQKARFFAFPPLEEAGEIATWTEWQEAYQRFLAA